MKDSKSYLLAMCVLASFCSHAWAADLPFGQIETGTISLAAQSNSYTFSASANDVVNFTIVTTSGKLSPSIGLYDSAGARVSYAYSNSPFYCDGGFTVSLNTVTLTKAGIYTVLLSDCFDTDTGSYAIFAQRTNNPVGAGSLSFGGQPQTGTISSVAQSNSYTFSASANDVVNFTIVTTSGKLSPSIGLYNSAGARVSYAYSNSPFYCDGGFTVSLNTVTLTKAGIYTVLLSDCFDTDTGSYAIFAQRTNNPVGAGSLSFGGQPQTGTISSVAQSNSYTFSASANDVVNFTIVTTSGKLSPSIGLYNSAGARVSYAYSNSPFYCNGGSTVELNNVKMPATGTYTFLISDCFDTNTGSYNLAAQCFGVCAAASPPPDNCTYSLAPAAQVLPAGAITGSVGVLTGSGCPWSASATSFLTITSGASGTGPGAVQFSASANSGAASRTASLTIGDQTEKVTQTGSAPLLLVTPSTIAVSYLQGNPNPPDIPVSVFTNVSTLSYTATVSASAPWLRLGPFGVAPGTLVLSIVPGSLAPGSYSGTVTISAPAANPPTQTVTVNLTIISAGQPSMSIQSGGFNFAFAQGSQARTESRVVNNTGGGALTFQVAATATSGGNWLQATGSGAATLGNPGALTVTVDPSSLSPGTYTGVVSVTAGTVATNLPVAVTVNVISQTILLSQTGLTFTAVAQGGSVPPQTFGVLNIGQGLMDWSATASVISGSTTWLSVSPASGTTDASSLTVPEVTVSASPTGLAAGDYYGQIRIESKAANNTPQFVFVVMTVLPAGSDPGPVVRPTGLIFTAVAGGVQPASQTVQLSNVTGTSHAFAVGVPLTLDGQPWLTKTTTTGTIASGQTANVTVTANSTGLVPFIRRGVITLALDDGQARTVNVLFVLLGTVNSSTTSNGRSAQGATQAAVCSPTMFLPLVTSLGANFVVPASWPNTIEANIVDDCGNPMISGSVVTTFSNGDPPLPLVPLKDGRWSGTWQVLNANASNVIVTVTAQNAPQNLKGVATVSGGLRSNVDAPLVSPGGVVNLANYAVTPLAPGDIVGIFGVQLSQGTGQATQLPLDTTLAGTIAVLGGQQMPLFYASGGLVNAVIPFGLPPNTQQQLIVQRGSTYTVPVPIAIAAAMPAVYTKDGSGKGQGTIVDLNGNFVDASNPAAAGDTIVIYCNGLGDVDQPVAAGAAAPSSPLARTASPTTVTIAGQPANVQFAGLVPTLTALYVVDAIVPTGITPGSQVPVVITVAGQSSAPVTIAVK